MSSIGPGNIGALNLVGSFAGAQRANADVDGAKAESADRKFQIDQRALSSDSLENVGEPELSSDRDADGRLLYAENESEERKDREEGDQAPRRSHPDAYGESGRLLDLEA